MAAPSLLDALEALEARKLAVLGEVTEPTSQEVAWEDLALMISGFDIGASETAEVSMAVAARALQAALAGADLVKVFRSVWMDGLGTGLMHGHLRAGARRADPDGR